MREGGGGRVRGEKEPGIGKMKSRKLMKDRIDNVKVVPPSQEWYERCRPLAMRLKVKNESDFYRWLAFLDVMALNDKSSDNGGWVFRGQADADWPIKSSFERAVTETLLCRDKKLSEDDLLAIERLMLAKFRDRCGDRFNIMRENVMGWMCTMQHYGAPTRLVDFSVSPLVSLYMAVVGQYVSAKDLSVWAIYRRNYQTVYNSRIPMWFSNAHTCNNTLCSCDDIRKVSARKEDTLLNVENGYRSNWECANCFLNNGKCKSGERKRNFPKVLWIVPEVTNPRLLNQGGLFLMPTSLGKTTMQQLFWKVPSIDNGRTAGTQFMKGKLEPISNVGNAAKTSHLIQFVFSKELSPFIARFLTRANIRGTTLFPDVDGVAAELRETINCQSVCYK